MLPLHFALRSVRTRVGTLVGLDDWAKWARVPFRGRPGEILDGDVMSRIIGIRSKAWEPETFRDPRVVSDLGHEALSAARLEPAQVEALVLVSCTPFEINLDQDAHRLSRALGLPDHVPVVNLATGCAGLARTMSLLSRMNVANALVLSWNSPGAYMTLPDGRPNPLYLDNGSHPDRDLLWCSPALFSDGAAAAVFVRTAGEGLFHYSRDWGPQAGIPDFSDPLVVYLGGGAKHPPGTPQSALLSTYAMHGEAIRRYYIEGMLANNRALDRALPDWRMQARRIYTHQASPGLIAGFAEISDLPRDRMPTNCITMGNLVSVSTLHLLAEDLKAGRVASGDLLCFSVVGAGPERGAFLIRYRPADDSPVKSPS